MLSFLSRNPVVHGQPLSSTPDLSASHCLIWTTASAHSRSEKLEEGEGDQFCSGNLSLPSSQLLQSCLEQHHCELQLGPADKQQVQGFLLGLTPTPPHTHTSSSTHIKDLLSLLQPTHTIFPLRPRGEASSSFLWLFCSGLAGTGQTCHHTWSSIRKAFFSRGQLRSPPGSCAALCHHLAEGWGWAPVSSLRGITMLPFAHLS